MRRTLAIALWCALPLLSQDMTTVQDKIFMANGAMAQGTIKIEFPYYCTGPNGKTISMTGFTVNVAAGVFSAKLQPNDTCNSTYYIATYDLRNGPQTNTQREYWIVPTSTTPVSIDSIRQANTPSVPPYQFPLSQLGPGNARGDLILFNGVSWVAAPKCADGYTIIGNLAHPSNVGWSCAALPTSGSGGGSNVINLAPTDDTTPVGSGTTWQGKALPNCATNALGYNRSTNTFVCNTLPAPAEAGYTATFTSQDPLVIAAATHHMTACPAEVMIWTVSGTALTRTEGYDSVGCNSSTIAVTVDFPASASGIVYLMPTGGGGGGGGGGSESSHPPTVTFPGSPLQMNVESGYPGDTALRVIGEPSQTADIFQVQSSASLSLLSVQPGPDANGQVTLPGDLGVGTTTPTISGTGKVHFSGDTARPFDTDSFPATMTEACNKGEIRFSTYHVYFCVATNTWRRSALSIW